MGERTMYAPDWFIIRRAKALRVPVRVLRQVASDYAALVTRAKSKIRCEGCGVMLWNEHADPMDVRPSVPDEDGFYLCIPCAEVTPDAD